MFAVKLRGDLTVWLLLLQCGVCVTLVRGDCARPPRLNDGYPDIDLTQNSFPVSFRIRYRCNPGFLLAEGISPLITCQADTSWTAIRTQCEARSCGAPPDIEHGSYQTTSIVFGGRVTYRCDEGYELVGKTTQNCVAEGWDGRSPKCDPVACPDLPPIQNGRTPHPPQDFWVYPNAAVFTCNPTYTLIGENTIHCQANRQWSGNPPQCKVVKCLLPIPPIKNGIISSGFGPTYKYGESIIFKCNEGFRMVGNDSIECSENSTFGPVPQCVSETRNTSPVTVSGGSGTQMTSSPHPTSDSETRSTSSVTVSGGSGTQMTSSPHPTSDSETRSTSSVTVSGGSGTQMTSGPHPTSDSASHIDRSFIYGQNLLLVLLLLLERIL